MFDGLGATHYRLAPPVRRVVEQAIARHPGLTWNSYTGHPWPGWGAWSVDFWGPGGRGDPADYKTLWDCRNYLMRIAGRPMIRHTILRHQLWTSWGGETYWKSDDHSGRLQHLHVTYWKL
jgi:hypothetical protein